MVTLQDRHEEADEPMARTADGRTWGPFDSPYAARKWEEEFSASHGNLFTARDVFEGRVQGEGFYLVSPMAIEFGMHPLTEIYDWSIRDDNGRVVADLSSGMALLDPETPVFVSEPVRLRPERRLPGAVPPPREADIVSSPEASFPSRVRGEVVVLHSPGEGWLVAWRADGRARRGLRVLSLHGLPECARHAARHAARQYVPPPSVKSLRPRDGQREKVYSWEHSFPHARERFGNLEECRLFAEDVCALMGLKPPRLSEGRRSLKNHSYFSPLTGIVLQKDMMDSHTLIHELAHYAIYMGRGRSPRDAAHSPRFAGTLAGMLAAFASADLEEALDAAAKAGVEIDEECAKEYASLVRSAAYR